MKRTIIQFLTQDGKQQAKFRRATVLEGDNWWHGDLHFKMKDGVPVDGAEAAKKIKLENIEKNVYIPNNESENEQT